MSATSDTQIWRGQEADVTIEQSGSVIPVGILQDVEVAVEWEYSDLRGAGSPKRQDDQKTAVDVSITGEFAAWAYDAFDLIAQYDEGLGGLSESSDVQHFDVIGTFESSDGSHTKDITVVETRFPAPSIGGSPDDWVGLTIEGEGADIDISNTTP